MIVKKILLTKIQRFSLHDGPGIRTTVFLKGCSLCCPWCCNPENIISETQRYIKDGVENIYGEYGDTNYLYEEIIRDCCFYKGEIEEYNINDSKLLDELPGGVTFTGGEPLLQMMQLETILDRLKKEHVHITVETSLFVPKNLLLIAIKYIDLFYVDVKLLHKDMCKEHLNGNLEQYLENLQILFKSGKPVIVRIPVIGGYTEKEENRIEVCRLLEAWKKYILKVELIKGHNLGISKYYSLIEGGCKISLPVFEKVSDEMMKQYKSEVIRAVEGMIPVEILKI